MPSVLRPFFLRSMLLAGVGLLLSMLMALTPIGHEIELKLGDALSGLAAPAGIFDEVVVVDVDEDSMTRLAPQIGVWPYDRDIYAHVNDYLLASGATAVAFDILFSEPRKGDRALASTIDKRVALAAVSLPFDGRRDADYRRRLDAAGWAGARDWPARTWQDVTLPLEEFAARGYVGVISVNLDRDGSLRRMPLLHRVGNVELPGLAIAALRASGQAPKFRNGNRSVWFGDHQTIPDSNGEILLHFPKTFSSLRVVPFWQVAVAASGAPAQVSLAQEFRGKIVYVGSSSAVLGDFIQTPRGRISGLYLAAIVPSMLQQGMTLRARHWATDGVMIALALLLAFAASHPYLQSSQVLQVAALPIILLLTAAAAWAFFGTGRAVVVLAPLVAGGVSHLGAAIWRQIHLFRRSQALLLDKLAAEEAARLKSQFLSHMTHELRTPLTAIMGFNNINWQTDHLGREQRIANSEVIDRNGKHLLTLINNILDQAKLEAGQVGIVTHPERLAPLIQDVLVTLQPLVRDKPLTLQAKISDRVPEVLLIDAFRVRQILLNLIGNAIKFTERGEVSVEVTWEAGRLDIGVVDKGPGMDASALSRLFIAFQQASDRVAATHGGTGLGLTISQNLAVLMGGDISVASEPGKGSRFDLRIPAAAAEAPTDSSPVSIAPKPDAQTAGRAAGTVALRGTVLLAEDTDDLRMLAALYLKKLGLNVLEAVNGKDAVEIALREQPDAILMDLEMPLLHGLDAVSQLRAAGYAKPILAMTAHTDPGQLALALAAGCNDTLSKPVTRAQVQSALYGALGTG